MIWVPTRQRMQHELLKRGHCVACTRSLSDADRSDFKDDDQFSIVRCQCNRVYIYDKGLNTYRRATDEEL